MASPFLCKDVGRCLQNPFLCMAWQTRHDCGLFNLLKDPSKFRPTDILMKLDILLSFWVCWSDTAAQKIKVEWKGAYSIRRLPVKKISDI